MRDLAGPAPQRPPDLHAYENVPDVSMAPAPDVRYGCSVGIVLLNEPWNDSSRKPEDGDIHWNMWQSRIWPYHDLEVSDRIVLVSAGGPKRGMLSYEVEITALVRDWYESHAHAWKLVRAALDKAIAKSGLTRGGFLHQQYTIGKADTGWIVAFSTRPLRKIMKPRPTHLRFRQNGWAMLDDLDEP